MANLCEDSSLSHHIWENENLKNLTPLRILFIRSNPCNPDIRVQKEVASLSSLHTKISILAWDRDNTHNTTQITRIKSHAVTIYRLGIKAQYSVGLKNLFPLLRFQIQSLCFLLRHRKQIDCIHACDFDTILPAFLIAKCFNKTLIYDIFDYYVDSYNVPRLLKPFIKKLDTLMIEKSDACIICSDERIHQIAPAKPKTLEVIHNAPYFFKPHYDFTLQNAESRSLLKYSKIIKIAYVGVLAKERYLEDLLEIVANDTNLELHIGGYGILESLVQSFASKYPNIYFYGKIPYEQTLELEAQCDVMTALYAPENRNHFFAAPNKFYESLMLQKPVIMIKNTGMSEIVESNNIGEVIEFSQSNLSQAIYKAYEGDSKQKQQKRLQLYMERYGWEIMGDKLTQLYVNLCPKIKRKPLIMLIFGTRPEAIKMSPLAKELKKHTNIHTLIVLSGQHKDMPLPILERFGLKADINLNIAKPAQSLEYINIAILTALKPYLEILRPNMVCVHGDTQSAFATSLSCFYHHIPLTHVEAGLRTYNLQAPFPEEYNRQAIALSVALHFAPTAQAKANLIKENKNPDSIFVVGNTAIDALHTMISKDFSSPLLEWVGNDKLIVLTAHRRENLGENLKNIFKAIAMLLDSVPNIKVIYPIHPNPFIQTTIKECLKDSTRLKVIPPLDVFTFHNLLNHATLILTDSGGIQEEAPSLNKPVLVLREKTERTEGVESGTLKLIGTNANDIYTQTKFLLENKEAYNKMASAQNPYGDGKASEKITQIILEHIFAGGGAKYYLIVKLFLYHTYQKNQTQNPYISNPMLKEAA